MSTRRFTKALLSVDVALLLLLVFSYLYIVMTGLAVKQATIVIIQLSAGFLLFSIAVLGGYVVYTRRSLKTVE